ncbi:hypothetical protein [Alkalibacillus haloalkaliphilus]|uniref:hypothetical protein n=1 Tax=Alkalibacillus haloalkaliphilus TaxID=94136 RepID=UPI0029362BE9|nr:hypothetical protein [Alkalibacillus haloalkaliphilus]MDV2581387.1 hypothetical protein [Alkalibacillus haloalkaliphilus]
MQVKRKPILYSLVAFFVYFTYSAFFPFAPVTIHHPSGALGIADYLDDQYEEKHANINDILEANNDDNYITSFYTPLYTIERGWTIITDDKITRTDFAELHDRISRGYDALINIERDFEIELTEEQETEFNNLKDYFRIAESKLQEPVYNATMFSTKGSIDSQILGMTNTYFNLLNQLERFLETVS